MLVQAGIGNKYFPETTPFTQEKKTVVAGVSVGFYRKSIKNSQVQVPFPSNETLIGDEQYRMDVWSTLTVFLCLNVRNF
jgi:hypothetical protein